MAHLSEDASNVFRNGRMSVRSYVKSLIHNTEREPAPRSWDATIRDPVGNAIRELAVLHTRSNHASGIHLERLLTCTLNDEPAGIQKAIADLKGSIDERVVLDAIATLAGFHCRVKSLAFCLEHGVSLQTRDVLLALEYTTRTPELLDLLHAFDWRGMKSSPHAFQQMASWSLHTNVQELNWFLARGAHFTNEMVQRAIPTAPLQAPCVQMLIHMYGVNLVRNSGLLQNAAKRGQQDVVKVLLMAGVDPNELASPCIPFSSEQPQTALYEAMMQKHEHMVQLLLEFGANPDQAIGGRRSDTPRELAKAQGYTGITELVCQSPRLSMPRGHTHSSRL